MAPGVWTARAYQDARRKLEKATDIVTGLKERAVENERELGWRAGTVHGAVF
jgi:hypothetical protein